MATCLAEERDSVTYALGLDDVPSKQMRSQTFSQFAGDVRSPLAGIRRDVDIRARAGRWWDLMQSVQDTRV